MRNHWIKVLIGMLFVAGLAVVGTPRHAAAATCTFTSNNSGNWTDTGIWTIVGGGGCPVTAYPGNTSANMDTVIIASGTTVTLDVSPTRSLSKLTINGGGTLILGNDTTARDLKVSRIVINGTLRPNDPGSITRHSLYVESWDNTGTFTATNGNGRIAVTFAGYGYITGVTTFWNLAMDWGGTILNNDISIDSGDLTVISGTFDLGSYTANRTTDGGTLTVNDGATLKLGGSTGGQPGSNFPTNYSTVTLAGCATVEYSGGDGVDQTVYTALAYGSLVVSNSTFSGASTKTVGANLTIACDLTIKYYATLDLSTYTADRSTSGGMLTVSEEGTLKIGGKNTLPSNYDTHSIAATSTIEYAGTDQTIATLHTSQSYWNLTLSGSGTKTLAGSMTVAGALTLSSDVTLAVGSNSLTLDGSVTCAGTLSSDTNGTVTYGGDDDQAVCAGNYGELTTGGGGTKMLQGVVTASGNVTIGLGTTLDVSGSNFPITVGGNWMNHGTFTPGTGTVTFNGASQTAQATSTISVFSDDLESATDNWSHDAASGTDDWTLVTTDSHSTTHSWYAANLGENSDKWLWNAAPIALPGNAVFAQLTFWHQYCFETYWDGSVIEISTNGVTWNDLGSRITQGGYTTLWPNYSPFGEQSLWSGFAAWNRVAVDLTSFIGKSVQVRFRMYTANSSASFTGWWIDDVVVVATDGLPSGLTFNNLTIASGTTTLGGNVTTNGALTIQSQAELADSGRTITVNGDVDNDGTHSGAGKILLTGGSTAHTLAGSGTYQNLELDDSNGATLSGSPTVNGVLTLTSGLLTLGANNLTLNDAVSCGSSTISGSASSTVNYNQGSAGQNVCAGNYYNLTFSDYTKTLAPSGTIGIANAFTPGSATGHTITSSTVDFDGTEAQTVPAFTYNNLTISGARTTNSVTLANSGILAVADNFNPVATFAGGGYVATGSTVDFNGAGAQTVPAFSYNNLTLSGARDTNSVTLASSGTIYVVGAFSTSATFTTGSYVPGSSTVNLNGTAAQTIGAFTFYNLTIGNTAGASLTGDVTVNRILTLGGNLAAGAYNLTLNNDVNCNSKTISGTTGGTVNYNGSVNGQKVCNGNYYNLAFSNFTKVIRSGTYGIAGAFAPGAATGHDIAYSTVSFNGTSGRPQIVPAFDFYSLTIGNDAGVSLSGGVIVERYLNLDGHVDAGANNLTLNYTVNCSSKTMSGSAGGTVTYNQNSDGQAVCAGNYYNLTLSNYNKKLPSGAIVGVAGLFTPGTAVGHTVSGSTVDFNGTGAQTVPAFTFNKLTVSNSAGASLSGAVTVNAELHLSGNLDAGANNLTLNSIVTCNGNTIGGSASSTVNYNQGSAGQAVCAGNYYNLTFSGYNKTLASSGAVGVAGAWTPGSAMGHTVAGSTVSFNGGSAQTIPAFTFDNLMLSNSAGVSLGGTVTVNSALTLANGVLTVGSEDLIVGESATITTGASFDASHMLAADGTGQVCKNYAGTGAFTFPIGDNTGTPEYSPATLDFTTGSFSGSTQACLNLTNAIHPSMPGTDHIARYWTVTTDIANPICTVTFYYVDADVHGPEGNLSGAKWDTTPEPARWTVLNAVHADANFFTATVNNFSQFSAGNIIALAVEMADFRGELVDGQVVLTWETVSEQDNAGFNVYRGESEIGPWTKANASLIGSAAPGSSGGHVYRWTGPAGSAGVQPGTTGWYLLEDVDLNGTVSQHGPVHVEAAAPNAVHVQRFAARSDWGELLRRLLGAR